MPKIFQRSFGIFVHPYSRQFQLNKKYYYCNRQAYYMVTIISHVKTEWGEYYESKYGLRYIIRQTHFSIYFQR